MHNSDSKDSRLRVASDGSRRLSRRQYEIASHYADGLTYKQIASRLFISPSTVRNHLAAIYRELGVRNKVDLVKAIAILHTSMIDRDEDPDRDAFELSRSTPERRQVTIVYSNLSEFEASVPLVGLAGSKNGLSEYKKRCTDIMESFGGHIAELTAASMTTYFGYPRASENAAENAIRAGLALVRSVNQGETDSSTMPGYRVAITTSIVTMGRDDELTGVWDQTAFAQTRKLEAMQHAHSASSGLMVSAATRELCGELFDYHSIGEHSFAMDAAPVELYCVTGERPGNSRFASRATRLVPLAGRQAELYLLRDRWADVADGKGQVVVLTGEAGIGKSRIVHELRIAAEQYGDDWHQYQCSAYHTNTALNPFVDYLRGLLMADEEGAVSLNSLQRLVEEFDEDPVTAVPLLGTLLGISLEDHHPALKMNPDRQRQATLELLVRLTLVGVQAQPQFIVFEDVHWLDPSSAALLELLVDQVQSYPALMIITARPEFTSPWPSFTHITTLTLNRLSREHVFAMIDALTDKALAPCTRAHIADHTDGVPLFVEELTRTLIDLESTIDPEPSIPPTNSGVVPTTLRDALMARLDKHPVAREIAQHGACIGREFPREILTAILPLAESQMDKGLDQLVTAGLLFCRGAGKASIYLFKHALVRDVANQSMLKSHRQELHAKIATVLEGRFSDLATHQPELIAHHLTEAGLLARAVGYWQKAGVQSVARSNNVEAIEQLQRALSQLTQISNDQYQDRVQLELDLRLTLGVAQQAVLGYASQQVKENYARADALYEKSSKGDNRIPILRGLYIYYLMRGDLARAHHYSQQLLQAALESKVDSHVLEAHFAIGQTYLFHIGDFRKAGDHFSKGTEIYDIERHGEHAYRFGQDPGVYCLQLWAFGLQMQGQPDSALQRSLEARELAKRLNHPLSLASAFIFAAQLHQWRNEPNAVNELVNLALPIAEQQHLPFFIGWAQMLAGWARTYEAGEPDWETMERGLDMFPTSGTGLGFTICSGVYAGAQYNAGRYDGATQTLEHAMKHAQKSQEPYIVPELLRIQGLTEIARNRARVGLQTLQRARQKAQDIDAKFWQLRIEIDIDLCHLNDVDRPV